MLSARAASDPFYFPQSPLGTAYSNARGKTGVDPRPVAGDRNLVMVSAGQSHATNAGTGPHTVTEAVHAISIVDGGMYVASDPLLGTSSDKGTWLSRFGDLMISGDHTDRVIHVPAAMGGASILDYVRGGNLHPRLIAAVHRSRALGWEPSCFVWQQGQADLGMAQATYQAHLMSIINSVRALGAAAPWFIALSSITVSTGQNATMRAAQTGVTNGVDIFVGADDDTLTGGTYREADIHFKAAGLDALAALWVTAITAEL